MQNPIPRQHLPILFGLVLTACEPGGASSPARTPVALEAVSAPDLQSCLADDPDPACFAGPLDRADSEASRLSPPLDMTRRPKPAALRDLPDRSERPSRIWESPAEEARRVDFESLHSGEDAELDLVVDAQGALRAVLGRFHVGVTPKDLHPHDLTRVAAAVAAFVERNADAFRIDRAEPLDLVPVEGHDITDDTFVVTLEQRRGGIRVLEGQLTAAFLKSDGALRSLDGPVVSGRRQAYRMHLGADDALALSKIAKSASGPMRVAEGQAFPVFSSEASEITVEPVFSIHSGLIWLVVETPWTIVVDDETGAIVRRSSAAHDAFSSCTLRRFEFPRNAQNQATSLVIPNPSGSCGGSFQCAFDSATCEGDDFFGTCAWQLRRETNTVHAIARIQDTDGSERERRLPCTSTPVFTATNGDMVREQSAFWAVNTMRYFVNQNVWSRTTPTMQSNVTVFLDDASLVASNYQPWRTDIFLRPLDGRPDIIWHEYGHYTHHTYGDILGACTASPNRLANLDEGSAVAESVANVFGLLTALDDPQTAPRYGALAGFANQAPAPHTNAASIVTNGVCCVDTDPDPFVETCAANTLDIHFVGRGFEQAMWELMWNRDCSVSPFCNASSSFGQDVFQGQSQEQVILLVGASLGFALAVTGTNVTFPQLRTQIRARLLELTASVAAANRAVSVMAHHGF